MLLAEEKNRKGNEDGGEEEDEELKQGRDENGNIPKEPN